MYERKHEDHEPQLEQRTEGHRREAENDRRRYTVCPDARKEIMARLLKLNNDRHKQEVAAGLVDETGKLLKKSSTTKPKKKKATTTDQIELL